MHLQHQILCAFPVAPDVAVVVTDRSVTSVAEEFGAPAAASAGIRFNNDGKLQYNLFDGLGWIDIPGEWLVGGGAPGDYSVRATLTSGDAPDAGSLNTWLVCNVAREWRVDVNRNVGGSASQTSVLLFEVRLDSAPSPPQDSATITLSATAIRTG